MKPKLASDTDTIVHFWEWYNRRQARGGAALTYLALNNCEEAFHARDWDQFAYWHSVFVRERSLPRDWTR